MKKTLEHAREEARTRYGHASPYRVGFFVALLDVECENPYPCGSRGWTNYEDGIAEGRKRAQAAQQRQGEGGE